MTDVTYFFDPACPWTWLTTKWLRQVEKPRALNIEWRSFSLLVLNGDKVPEQYRGPMEASHAALRAIEAMRKDGRNADVFKFYEAVSRPVHDEDIPLSLDFVSDALTALGLGDYVPALSDTALDAVVEESTNIAIALAGPDIGSPVITFPDLERGFHGPIIASVPDAATSDNIWNVVSASLQIPDLLELKRGR